MAADFSKLDSNQVLRRSYDDSTNRLRVDAAVTTTVADMDLDIDAASGDNIAISDGVDTLNINPDGSINVNVVTNQLTTHNIFAEIENVASGVTSTIKAYVMPNEGKLLSLDVGGTNIATYSLYVNGNLSAKKYTYFQNLNERFDFKDGLPLPAGTEIRIEVVHSRPDLGSFNVNLLVAD